MKQRIFFSGLLVIICLFSFAQKEPFTNVYAYSQATLSGTKPKTTSGENGNQVILASRENINYYFYAEYPSKENFTVVTLWIKGKPYELKTDIISKTPIETIGNNSKKITLVPLTTNEVLLLTPGSQVNMKPRCRLRKMLKKAELVIVYSYNDKKRYYSVSKIKELEIVPGI
jgi:hypothetical protein